MNTSIEMRWFLHNVPREICAWFESHRPASADSLAMWLNDQSEISDMYLEPDNCDTLSIKFRGGQLEIKKLHTPGSAIRLSGKTEGIFEKWTKWKLPMQTELQQTNGMFEHSIHFLQVRKKRVLIKYGRINGEMILVYPDNEIKEGCQVECTLIKTDELIAYSFGFESFGREENIEQNFAEVVQKVFDDLGDIRLLSSDSYSYPVFLKNRGRWNTVYELNMS